MRSKFKFRVPDAQFDIHFDPQQVLDQILNQLHPGAIILLHDGLDNANAVELSQLVEELIIEIENRGYRFVTEREELEDLL